MASAASVALSCGIVPLIDRVMAVLEITPEVNRARFRHNVLVLDCSGSMWSSIESVKTDACQFINELDENNYVSVVIFSGHDRAKLLTGPVLCRANGRQVLVQAIRQGVHIMDTTVFSEPLELVLEHLNRLSDDHIASQAVLFTDGRAVPTRWGLETEETKALVAAKALYEHGAAVSVMAYGAHYDEDFVRRLVMAGGSTGIFRHMSRAEDFAEVVRDIQGTFAKIELSNIKLTITPGQGEVTAIYRALPEVLKLSTGKSFSARGLYDQKLVCYIDLTAATDKIYVTGSIDGQTIKQICEPNPLTSQQQLDCLRLIASHLAASGQTTEAAELFIQLDEPGLAEMLTQAYTRQEQRRNHDWARRAFRTVRFIGAGLKPSGPNRCVMNVLATLANDPSVVMSLPAGAYKRGGIRREDPRIVASPMGSTLKVVSYTGNEQRFNFSVTTQKDVKVLPAGDDGNIIEGAPVPAVVYRTYNLIRDGELVMDEIVASMSEPSFTVLQAAGAIDAHEVYKPGRSYTLRLADMPMVSSNWARPGSLGLIEVLQQIAEIKVKQTALNSHTGLLGKPNIPEFDGNVYNERAETVAGAELEYYTASHMELRLMGYKARKYTDEVSQFNLDDATAAVKHIRRELRRLRFRARCIAFACEATGWNTVNWGEPVQTQRGTFPKQEYTASLGGQRVKRVVWEADVPFS